MNKPNNSISFHLKNGNIVFFGGYCNLVEYNDNTEWVIAKNHSKSEYVDSEVTILGRVPYENILYIDYGIV